MTIALQSIKEQQDKLAEMITTFEANEKLSAAFPITINFPTLNANEQYVGAIVSANGAKREHIILLPGEVEDMSWQAAMDWAASIGGHLPARNEQSLLFANCKAHFVASWYWSNTQNVAGPYYAWMQGFNDGNQYNARKSNKFRARAVRRILIEECV